MQRSADCIPLPLRSLRRRYDRLLMVELGQEIHEPINWNSAKKRASISQFPSVGTQIRTQRQDWIETRGRRLGISH